VILRIVEYGPAMSCYEAAPRKRFEHDGAPRRPCCSPRVQCQPLSSIPRQSVDSAGTRPVRSRSGVPSRRRWGIRTRWPAGWNDGSGINPGTPCSPAHRWPAGVEITPLRPRRHLRRGCPPRPHQKRTARHGQPPQPRDQHPAPGRKHHHRRRSPPHRTKRHPATQNTGNQA
jgi:hypothetical protein